MRLHGQVVHTLFPDLVTWGQITVELKSIPRHPGRTEFVQLFNYLKHRGDRLGLLVNLGLDRVHVERIIYEWRPTYLEEDWSYWLGQIEGPAREIGMRTRAALRAIYREHGTGYGDEVVRNLILFALMYHGLSIVQSPVVKSYYGDIEIGESPLDCIVVENAVVLCHTALFDSNEFNMNRGRSYMRALRMPWGIAANFGKTQAQFTGLHVS